jgi:DNA-binding response OmpR family regulator
MDAVLQKVLVVEDNANIRKIVTVALEKVGGLTVCACESGAQALESVGEFGPQLILLDMMMPGMDGLTLLRLLRERADTAGIPVVFLTAKTTPNEVNAMREAGALDVIGKPFAPRTLHTTVKGIWAAAFKSVSAVPGELGT